MLHELTSSFIPERLREVDSDYLDFELTTISSADLERVKKCINTNIKITNPYNSIILYVTNVTDEFDFTKGRSDTIGGTPADIDIDFDDRAAAIDWTIKHWGADRVAKILTHGTYGVKSGTNHFFEATAPKVIWDSTFTTKLNQKQLDKHWATADKVKNNIPEAIFGKAPDMAKVFEETPSLAEDEDLIYWREYMAYVENKILNYGVHASGVIITDVPLSDVIPLSAEHTYTLNPDGTTTHTIDMVTQFPMAECEAQGAVKFDFLRIENLSICKNTIELIRERGGPFLNLYTIADYDDLTYKLLNQGYVSGVWQFETSGSAKQLILTCQPKSIGELSDLTALNRPGPMSEGPNGEPSIVAQYIENKNNSYPPASQPEVLSEILKETHYSMIYQEQVMRICSELAGFTLREADDIRRAQGKKKKEVIQPYEVKFMEGCARVGKVSPEVASILWNQMVNFADYAFNAAHSVSYSYLSYCCAYLKANYPVEFFVSLLSSRSADGNKWEKAGEYIYEIKARDIEVKGPNINISKAKFSAVDDKIYWGFSAIKGIGASTGIAIEACRGTTKFKDIWDFLERVDRSNVNTGNFKSLALAGAFDCLGYIRQELAESAQDIYDQLKAEEKYQESLIKLTQVQNENSAKQTKKNELINLEKEAKARVKTKTQTQEDNWILNRADRLRNYKEKARLAKLQDIDIETLFTEEEYEEYTESLWLRSKAEPKPKEPPERIKFGRLKQLPITVNDLVIQKKLIGTYLGAHPVDILFPNVRSFENIDIGDRGAWAGEITEVKEITTRKKTKMAFAVLENETHRCELVIFPQVWAKLTDSQKANLNTTICLVRGRIESTEPLKLIVDFIKLSENI